MKKSGSIYLVRNIDSVNFSKLNRILFYGICKLCNIVKIE